MFQNNEVFNDGTLSVFANFSSDADKTIVRNNLFRDSLRGGIVASGLYSLIEGNTFSRLINPTAINPVEAVNSGGTVRNNVFAHGQHASLVVACMRPIASLTIGEVSWPVQARACWATRSTTT